MMTKLELAPFTATEMNYIKEYCKVSEPVAVALDMLQAEARAYFGTLLPIIIVAKQKLEAMISTRGVLQHCKDYAKALLEGLDKRFKHLESDEKCLLASAFHPKFRQLLWLSQEKQPGLRKKMENLVAANLKKRVEGADQTFAVDNDNGDDGTSAETELTGADYFSSITVAPTARGRRNLIDVNATNIVKTWTETTGSEKLEDSDFQREPSLIDLFIEFNTPVPSSAGVERLFSQAGDILRPKRCSLKEDRFHQLMFMRGNRHHWETYTEG
jgi:hypothetical protein